MPAFSSVDDLAASAGAHIGDSSWIQIDQERINMFADATGDHEWLHVDPERAASGPFGGTIAHGFLTLSLVAAIVGEVVTVGGNPTAVNYGLEKVRFLRPVPVGSRVRGSVHLQSVETTPQGVRALLRISVELDDGGKPACVAEMISFYLA